MHISEIDTDSSIVEFRVYDNMMPIRHDEPLGVVRFLIRPFLDECLENIGTMKPQILIPLGKPPEVRAQDHD